MYKIENIREIDKLPEYMTENNHISQYVLRTGKEPTNRIFKQWFQVARQAKNKILLLTINNEDVWVQNAELEYWLEILSKVKDNQVIAWYVAGSIASEQESSGLDGYQIHFIWDGDK